MARPRDRGSRVERGKKLSVRLPGAATNFDREPPQFSLRHVQDAHCITRCEKDDKIAFADRLRELSRMTWAEIRVAHRHGLGTEKIAQSAIEAGIPDCVTPE